MNKRKFSTITHSVLIFLILLVFTFLLGAPIIFFGNTQEWLDKNIAAALGYAIPMIATIYLVYWIIIKKEKSDIEKGTESKTNILNFSLGKPGKYLYIIIISLIMMLWVDFFASLIPMPDWAIELFEKAFNLSVPNIIMIAIFAPLLEEILVRGLVLRGYLQNYTPNKAIIASAIFFGFIHLNPWQFIAGFISGLLLGYLYYKTKSLTPSILVHFLNNSLSVIFMIYYPNFNASFSELVGGGVPYYSLLIFSMMMGYVVMSKLNNILNEEYNTKIIKSKLIS
ncbi:MAG: type II CAAX endopeptidase family protein [Bacteroidota bacterium]